MSTTEQIVIAGGGIGGLVLALTLHEIGVSCTVVETSNSMRPLGVGVNIQPNAVRELFDLGFTADELNEIGVAAKEWALVGLNGKEVYAEPRGTHAGYSWPQYAVHRGRFHMLLYKRVVETLGIDSVKLGARLTAYEQTEDSVTAHLQHHDGTQSTLSSSLLIGADGINSVVRAQMHPQQPPIHWGGKIMWRGTVKAKPIRTDSSFVGLGTHEHRIVLYPISATDESGLAEINWIAEVTQDNASGWQQDSWFREVELEEFAHQFDAFRYDWLDVPALLNTADCAYENPMIDRDPIPYWVDNRVALIGDAAHPMYPTGSNGASQAIVDARVLGAKLVQYGLASKALWAYNDDLCEPVSALVLRNRGEGPFGLLNLLNDRCEGVFDDIESIIPEAERIEFMMNYKKAAGFAKEALNSSGPTIAPGSRVYSRDA